MTNHKFKLGQLVRYVPDKAPVQTPIGLYTIMRLMPAEGRDRQYRIKTVAEPFERAVREDQLAVG